MKLYVLWFALVLMISACSASGEIVASEPLTDNSAASQKARADYALKDAQQKEADAHAAAVNETAQAKAANNVLSLAATATAQALAVARAQLAMTADAANLPSTQAAAFAKQTAQMIAGNATSDASALLQAQHEAQTTATDQAMSAQQTVQAQEAQATVDARAMLLAQQRSEVTATAQAMRREGVTAEQTASTSKWQNELMAWLIPLLAVGAFGVALLLGWMFIREMLDAANVRRGLENQRLALMGSLYETPKQTIVFANGLQPGLASAPRLHPADDPNMNGPDAATAPSMAPETPLETVLVPSNEDQLEERAEAREEAERCRLAMKLIRDAITHVGALSNRIPPAEQLDWPVGDWTIAVAILRPFGVENLPGTDGGIYLVGESPNLQALYNALGEKTLGLLSHTG